MIDEKLPLYIRYQPEQWEDFVGNPEIIESLRALVSRGHTHSYLFTGPPGSGKTTLAHMVARELGVDPTWGFVEINGGNDRGIDTIRGINTKVQQTPLSGGPKVYFIDEAHRLTKDSCEALLKITGEPLPHAYFILATSEPQRLSGTFKQRFTTYNLKALKHHELMRILRRVDDLEGLEISLEILKKISEFSEGSARQALVLLEQISVLDSEEKMLNLLEVSIDTEYETKALCQALLNGKWKEVTNVVKGLKAEHEQVIRAVRGYMRAVLLNNEIGTPKTDRATLILGEFLNIPYGTGVDGIIFACAMAVEK